MTQNKETKNRIFNLKSLRAYHSAQVESLILDCIGKARPFEELLREAQLAEGVLPQAELKEEL